MSTTTHPSTTFNSYSCSGDICIDASSGGVTSDTVKSRISQTTPDNCKAVCEGFNLCKSLVYWNTSSSCYLHSVNTSDFDTKGGSHVSLIEKN